MKKILAGLLLVAFLLLVYANRDGDSVRVSIGGEPNVITFRSSEDLWEFMEMTKDPGAKLANYLESRHFPIFIYHEDGSFDHRLMRNKEDVQVFLDAMDRDFLWLDLDGLELSSVQYRWDYLDVADIFLRKDGLNIRIEDMGTCDDYAKKWRKTWFRKEKLTKTFQVGAYTLEMGPLGYKTHNGFGEEDPRTEWTGYLMTETDAIKITIAARKPEYQNTDFLTAENFSIKTFAEIAAQGAPEVNNSAGALDEWKEQWGFQ